MGHYDDIPPEQLRSDLVRFARLLIRLDEEGRLLRAVPHIQSLLGDLRQKLFAHEVRGTKNLPSTTPLDESGDSNGGGPTSPSPLEEVDPDLRNSLRVVREAMARQDEAAEEWRNPGADVEDDRS